MGLLQDTDSADPARDTLLPGASTIRRFHLHVLEERVGRLRLALYLGLNASELAF